MKRLKPFTIFVLFVSFIVILSLLSYHFGDVFYPYHNIKNLIGLLGAEISFFILNRFGVLGYLVPVFLSLSLFSYDKGQMKFIRSVLFWVFFIASFDIVIYILIAPNRIHLLNHGYFICGSIGYILGSTVEFSLGEVGTFLILLPVSAGFLYLSQKEFIQFVLMKQVGVFKRNKKKVIKSEIDSKKKLENNQDYIALEEESPKRKRPGNRKKQEEELADNPYLVIDTEFLEKSKSVEQLSPAQQARSDDGYQFPSIELFYDPVKIGDPKLNREEIEFNAKKLEEKLRNFGVEGKVVGVKPGPVVTLYEFRPNSGVKISKIANLYNDLALSMEAMSVRIIAPIPGKAAVGIEISNPDRQTVYMKEIVSSKTFMKSTSKLTLGLGKDIAGNVVVTDLTKMPHLLIAGATGSGKSVSINTMIVSILYKARPDEVKFVMIDPKILELSLYDGIPHMMMPVVTDPKEAAAALNALISEMETRYKIMNETGVRNIEGFNRKARANQVDYPPMPYIAVVIDELADLMMVSGKKVEMYVERLAQKARASGIHMIAATQRPSVDVVTGLIKANFPARISFKVTSKMDSRTILDTQGAEALLGKGDMLFMQPGAPTLERVHGAFISDSEVKRITDFVKSQGTPEYNEELIEATREIAGVQEKEEELDPMFDEAVRIIREGGNPSISYLQRKLKIGYNKAARIVEQMEKKGILSKPDHRGKREILI